MQGKHILITGASSGIGLTAAQALAALGANVAIVGRNETRTRVGVAMRQYHGGHVGSPDTGCFEIFAELSGRRLVARPSARIDEDQLRLRPDHNDIVDEL